MTFQPPFHRCFKTHTHTHLDGSDGALLRRRDPFLHRTHVGGERRLVPHRGRYTSQQRRHLGTGLRESEDVVDEQQHVLSLLVTEVLGDGQAGQTDASSGAGGLVHLTVDEGHLRLVVRQTDDARLDHLVVQVVALARSLADPGEDGVSAVRLRDVVDQLHDEDGLADAGATEQTCMEPQDYDTRNCSLLVFASHIHKGNYINTPTMIQFMIIYYEMFSKYHLFSIYVTKETRKKFPFISQGHMTFLPSIQKKYYVDEMFCSNRIDFISRFEYSI